MTARDVLVGLLGEARADEVTESVRLAIEDELVWRRDERISVGNNNGLTINEYDGTPSGIRRMSTAEAVEMTLAAVLPDLLAPEVITTREEADALPDGSLERTIAALRAAAAAGEVIDVSGPFDRDGRWVMYLPGHYLRSQQDKRISDAAREYVRAYHLCDSGLTGLPLYEAQEAFDDAQQALVAAVEAEGAS